MATMRGKIVYLGLDVPGLHITQDADLDLSSPPQGEGGVMQSISDQRVIMSNRTNVTFVWTKHGGNVNVLELRDPTPEPEIVLQKTEKLVALPFTAHVWTPPVVVNGSYQPGQPIQGKAPVLTPEQQQQFHGEYARYPPPFQYDRPAKDDAPPSPWVAVSSWLGSQGALVPFSMPVYHWHGPLPCAHGNGGGFHPAMFNGSNYGQFLHLPNSPPGQPFPQPMVRQAPKPVAPPPPQLNVVSDPTGVSEIYMRPVQRTLPRPEPHGIKVEIEGAVMALPVGSVPGDMLLRVEKLEQEHGPLELYVFVDLDGKTELVQVEMPRELKREEIEWGQDAGGSGAGPQHVPGDLPEPLNGPLPEPQLAPQPGFPFLTPSGPENGLLVESQPDAQVFAEPEPQFQPQPGFDLDQRLGLQPSAPTGLQHGLEFKFPPYAERFDDIGPELDPQLSPQPFPLANDRNDFQFGSQPGRQPYAHQNILADDMQQDAQPSDSALLDYLDFFLDPPAGLQPDLHSGHHQPEHQSGHQPPDQGLYQPVPSADLKRPAEEDLPYVPRALPPPDPWPEVPGFLPMQMADDFPFSHEELMFPQGFEVRHQEDIQAVIQQDGDTNKPPAEAAPQAEQQGGGNEDAH